MWSRSALSSCTRHARATCLQLRARGLATVTETPDPSSSSTSRVTQNADHGSTPPSKSTINAAVILNRSPILTRTPTNFERTYYAYQARIQRALFNPFPEDFYFKQGSILEGKFAEEEREREQLAFGGPGAGKGKELNGDSAAATAPSTTEEVVTSAESKGEEPLPRIHEADIKNDVRSLDRQGERNLYLLLHRKDHTGKNVWSFPQGGLKDGELLHEAAERDLYTECGSSMDTWVVSRNPIGLYQPQHLTSTYVFFYKAHILAGQVKPDGNTVLDFAWLTKEEIEPRVDQEYWFGVRDMLSDF
ncbi:60S ribosomal protein L17 [Wolfiporia cocos MD-104 SS10]|uniref:Large ribosomal subunit protein mL46 n=1 Tax=Wolfiporia cocos (strain MD-104) TaxID=742152 RepID=A0A2H3J922_WOLCO|nr:60S ribosomal protein L17 [Wolfiporia cocos MD-104 SS10]